MNKAQYLALSAAAAVFLALYWGFDTTPPAHRTVERSRSLQGESTSFEALLENAKGQLTTETSAQWLDLEEQLTAANPDTNRVSVLKQCSAWWYTRGNTGVAGGFAEQVAELQNVDTAWSVAGALYFQALTGSQDADMRNYFGAHAVKAFESAVSLKPDQVEHRVNLALVYAENPPPDNPMQAVLLLRELEKQYPESPSVYNALGRLAIKTGQWARAVERLEKAWSLDPNNAFTPCLLAKAYEGAGQTAKATEFATRCNGK